MKQRLIYLLRFYVLTVVFFIIAKVVFMLCYQHLAHFTSGDVCAVVFHGLSLDLSTALYFLVVPFLLALASLWIRIPAILQKVYHAFVGLTFSLAFVADTSLYEFWRFKLDASCLQYLETPTEAMASVSTFYLLLRIAAILLIAGGMYVVYSWQTASLLPVKGIREKIVRTLLYLLSIPLMVIGIRGGIGDATTNIGQAYFSQNQFLNHSAVNPVFSFFYSMSHQLDDFAQYNFYNEEECDALVASVFTTESVGSDTLLTTLRPDILIILMEGAGEEFAQVMPCLQQLKCEGISFSQCYANSWRTDRGTVCTLSGYPSFPTVSVMKMPEKSRLLPSIAGRLKTVGYVSSYLYGGDANFTNMRSYLYSTGWDRLTDMADFTLEEQQTGEWGVRDDITFRFLFDDMTNHPGTPDKPRLWGFSTLSSHEPWDVPTKKHEDKVLNSFAYLDDCICDFIGRLKNTPVWERLLIVLVPDHGVNYGQTDQFTPLQKNHIPMIWLGGAVKEPRTVDRLCAQSDLAATLFGQLGLPHDDFLFSRDVLSRSYVHPTAYHTFSNAQWLIDSTGHVLYDFDREEVVVGEVTDSARLIRLNKAILQKTTTDLKNR